MKTGSCRVRDLVLIRFMSYGYRYACGFGSSFVTESAVTIASTLYIHLIITENAN